MQNITKKTTLLLLAVIIPVTVLGFWGTSYAKETTIKPPIKKRTILPLMPSSLLIDNSIDINTPSTSSTQISSQSTYESTTTQSTPTPPPLEESQKTDQNNNINTSIQYSNASSSYAVLNQEQSPPDEDTQKIPTKKIALSFIPIKLKPAETNQKNITLSDIPLPLLSIWVPFANNPSYIFSPLNPTLTQELYTLAATLFLAGLFILFGNKKTAGNAEKFRTFNKLKYNA